MAATITTDNATLFIIESPSIFAAGSASSNIEAQDKDRTVNVGHHIGRININISIRNPGAAGIIEATVFKVERAAATPVLGTHPVPSVAQINTQGSQQAMRLANPGKVFHFSTTPYTTGTTRTKVITVSPAKYKLSKIKAGDHWCLCLFNKCPNSIIIDLQMRYKEYE